MVLGDFARTLTDGQQSHKALGILYRRIKIRVAPSVKSDDAPVPWDSHPLRYLLLRIRPVNLLEEHPQERDYIKTVFHGYARELRAIRGIYSIAHVPLAEEEVFMGVILENTSHRRVSLLSSSCHSF